MKTTITKIHDVRGDDFQTIEMKVDDSKLAKLYGMLSNIYRNPIASIVREYASNAHDANIEAYHFKTKSWEEVKKIYPWVHDSSSKLSMDEKEFIELKKTLSKAGKDEPIIVDVERDKSEFVVKDYGIGLSPRRMEHVFFSYLSSTKEDTNTEIGGFGIGAKSALAYTNTFFIDTVYNGVEYKYMMTKNEKGMPVGKLILSKDSNDHNGTTIRVPIKEWSDLGKFEGELENMLLYLPNVYYKGSSNCRLNKMSLYKGNGWIVASSHVYSNMHVVLDNIPYQIDWNEIDGEAINVPIGLTFSTGELIPTPSRESLLYTPDTIKKIQDRIADFRNWVLSVIKKSSTPTNDIIKAYEAINSSTSKFDIVQGKPGDPSFLINLDDLFTTRFPSGGHSIPRSEYLSKTEFLPFKGSGYTLDTFLNTIDKYKSIFDIYGDINLLQDCKLTTIKEDSYRKDISYKTLLNNLSSGKELVFIKKSSFKQLDAHYYFENKYGKDGIKKILNGINWAKKHPMVLRERKLTPQGIQKLLYNHKVPDAKVQAKLLDLMEKFHKAIFEKIEPMRYNHLINPNYVRLYKAGKCFYKPKATVTIPTGMVKIKSYDKWFESTQSKQHTVEAKDLQSFAKNVVYGDNNEISLVKTIRDLIGAYCNLDYTTDGKIKNCYDATEFVIVYKSDLKLIEKLKMENWYSVTDACKDYKPLVRCLTAHYINNEYMNKVSFIGNVRILSDDLEDKITEINNYVNNNINKYFSKTSSYGKNPELEFMTELAVKADALDWNIISKVKEVFKFFKRGISLHVLYDNRMGIASRVSRHRKGEYLMANALRREGVPVQDKFYLDFCEYMLTIYCDGNDHTSIVNGENMTSAETCFYEDFHGKEEYLKLMKNESSKGGPSPNVQNTSV